MIFLFPVRAGRKHALRTAISADNLSHEAAKINTSTNVFAVTGANGSGNINTSSGISCCDSSSSSGGNSFR